LNPVDTNVLIKATRKKSGSYEALPKPTENELADFLDKLIQELLCSL